jgi:heavy metal response regulator
MRVLVVEDDPHMGTHLRKGLQEQGFAVDLVGNGMEALQLAGSVAFDLLILDRMLPGRDGLDVLRELRAQGIRTPTIFLTARAELADRITGLDCGADDYIAKPFAFAELMARVRAISRRGVETQSPVLQVADLRLDPAARTVERAGQRIELTAKQFTMLQYLMRHAGQVVTRTMIVEHVWNFQFEGLTNVVDVHINRLRNRVDRGFEVPLIHTLRGVGYVLRS